MHGAFDLFHTDIAMTTAGIRPAKADQFASDTLSATSSLWRRLASRFSPARAPAPADNARICDLEDRVAALDRVQAVVEFDLDGTIVHANENFLHTLGYRLDEIQGRHHRMFADPAYADSAEYREFWGKLGRGEYDAGVYRRIGKGGREVWIQASYNPVFDRMGRARKVVKFATDITAQKMQAADFAGQLAAIGKSQAVIEFDLTGRILSANENFLAATGYALDEVRGQHHSMFADDTYRRSAQYRDFWAKLGRGEYDAGVYRRIGKGGREIWIQASYNPIFDMNGTPFTAPHRRLGGVRGRRYATGARRGPHDGRHRRQRGARGRHACADQRRHVAAERGHRADQPGHRADGREHAAERGIGGGSFRRRAQHGRTGFRADGDGGGVPAVVRHDAARRERRWRARQHRAGALAYEPALNRASTSAPLQRPGLSTGRAGILAQAGCTVRA